MRRTTIWPIVLLICILACSAVAATPDKSDVEKRVEAILSKMTLEEKIDYIGGYNDFYVRAIKRLGVPELKMADGPMGVRNYGPSIAYPAGIAMAASWDTDLVNRIGAMMGKDSRVRGVHFLLGPGVNIYRAPMCGRNFEYFGEDPFLASRMAVANIRGIQSQGVIATVKHFAGNNQEWDRHNVSSDIDERTLREIYLPAFEASVREARVGAIMDAYNLVNGIHMTQHDYLNNQVVKKEWGFDGIIMSDWVSTYDGIAAANGGLDLEMPNGEFMNRKTLLPAIQQGKVSVATIDDKVRRILRKAIEFGFLDRGQTDESLSPFNHEGRQVALEAARSSMVLLKNNGVLPLQQARLKTVAVIGPTAHPAVTGGGGSSKVEPISDVSFLEGISTYVGSAANVVYAPGVAKPTEVFGESRFQTAADGGPTGLKAEYFDNKELSGAPALTRTDATINFQWSSESYRPNGPVDSFSARWTGYYVPEVSGEYRFYVSGDDGYRLYVDDKPLIERWQNQGETLLVESLRLEAGRPYKIRLEYFENIGTATIGFGITRSMDRALQKALAVASKADAVILCAGFDSNTEGEGWDRTFALQGGQDELISQILKVNKNTVVVLTGGGNVDMNAWADDVPALLHAWYPGQEGGTALAQVLFGDVSPSGKLPVSFERRLEDNAAFNSYYDPDKDKRVEHKEGVFLGYRHFDKTGKQPRFPFGYGLSYTTFEYSSLTVSPADANGAVSVTFKLKNTGKVAGAEVAQVYVSDSHAKVPRPVKELKGFAKVQLKPGETKAVEVRLHRRAFSYYDVESKGWTVAPGDFGVLVGASSQDIRLKGAATLK